MATNERATEKGDRKRFLVKCDGCPFERTTDGREEARRTGSDHQRETGHELIALEVPPSATSS